MDSNSNRSSEVSVSNDMQSNRSNLARSTGTVSQSRPTFWTSNNIGGRSEQLPVSSSTGSEVVTSSPSGISTLKLASHSNSNGSMYSALGGSRASPASATVIDLTGDVGNAGGIHPTSTRWDTVSAASTHQTGHNENAALTSNAGAKQVAPHSQRLPYEAAFHGENSRWMFVTRNPDCEKKFWKGYWNAVCVSSEKNSISMQVRYGRVLPMGSTLQAIFPLKGGPQPFQISFADNIKQAFYENFDGTCGCLFGQGLKDWLQDLCRRGSVQYFDDPYDTIIWMLGDHARKHGFLRESNGDRPLVLNRTVAENRSSVITSNPSPVSRRPSHDSLYASPTPPSDNRIGKAFGKVSVPDDNTRQDLGSSLIAEGEIEVEGKAWRIQLCFHIASENVFLLVIRPQARPPGPSLLEEQIEDPGLLEEKLDSWIATQNADSSSIAQVLKEATLKLMSLLLANPPGMYHCVWDSTPEEPHWKEHELWKTLAVSSKGW